MAETEPQILQRLGRDASKWAAEFRQTAIRLGYSDMDEGWLIGWFANAIENAVPAGFGVRDLSNLEACDAEKRNRIASLEHALLPFVALAEQVAREAITSPTDATSGLLTVRYKDLRLASAAYHHQGGDDCRDEVSRC